MKTALLIWIGITVLAVLLAMWWGFVTRPRLHSTPAPGATGGERLCPACGHIPFYAAPDCPACDGTGFIKYEETGHE